jgi:hypothetical protein
MAGRRKQMSDTFTLESGSDRKLRIVILGVIVAAFAIGAVVLTRPSDKAGAKLVPPAQAAAPASATTPASAAGANPATDTSAAAAVAPSTPPAAPTPAAAPESEPTAANGAGDAAATAPTGAAMTAAKAASSPAPSQTTPAARNEPAAPAPAAQSEVAASAGTATASSAPTDTMPAASAPASAKPADAGPFKVEYVGQAKRPAALAFRFSQRLADADDAVDHIHIVDGSGQPAPGVWVAGSNSDLLVYRNVAPGQYQVQIDPALRSADGHTLDVAWNGSVSVAR